MPQRLRAIAPLTFLLAACAPNSGGVPAIADAEAADIQPSDAPPADGVSAGDITSEDVTPEDVAPEDVAPEDSAPGDATAEHPHEDSADVIDRGPPNLVLVVLDDVGVEVVQPWATLVGATGEVVETPTLDALLDDGVAIETAWAGATCSPTRWTLHTGTYPSRGGPLGPAVGGSGLTTASATLPRILGDTYSTGLFGKWHLGGGNNAPTTLGGWDVYSGSPEGALADYFAWERVSAVAGSRPVVEDVGTYATTAVVDDALAWLGTVDDTRPWLTMLAFNAPHSPFHVPPESLRPGYPTAELDADGDGECDDDGPCHRAMLQALDSELGRFLRSIAASSEERDTIVIVLGDNGSPGSVVQAPFDRTHAKFTFFEGGIRVPMWVSGPEERVSERGTLRVMAHSADLFATLLEFAGAEVPPGVDAVSLVPALNGAGSQRDTLYMDGEAGPEPFVEQAAIRDARYKVQWLDVTAPDLFGCYDLAADPNEQIDLMGGATPPSECETLRQQLLETRR
ncbi:MAG: arylsulfatase A-like enzyme [Bradymonadia bacterium]|jgi:arylsulfatase A-like enzyme